MKDFLEADGLMSSPVTPRQALKDAFAAKVIRDGQVWIDMPDHRNPLSQTHGIAVFEKAVEAIVARYLPGMEQAHDYFLPQAGT